MKKKLLLLAVLMTAAIAANAQKKFLAYGVGFYNLENLFDITHDEGKNDYEFLPKGSYRWNAKKYKNKLGNMSRALADMGTDRLPGVGCAIIGVSEVENAHVLTDLCNQKPLKERNFKFVHVEGPDHRGVDCALLYNPSLFTVTDYHLYPYVYEKQEDIEKDRQTRGFLTVKGVLGGDNVAVIVVHLPSRFAGSEYRELGARQAKAVIDNILKEDPSCKVMIMGDMNDDPTNKSMTEGLRGKANIDEVGEGDMYNPWYNILVKEGRGTLTYNGSWNLFDQILLSPNLLNRNGEKEFSSLKLFQHHIFRRDYLIQNEGKYKGSPKRTHAGGVWLRGYSDHLPVVLYLAKEQQ
ncbi:MAG: endonuclease/exonuclease/phosphatase family protein [Prevotella sp.]|nr:endonuclease/exonuclease/phosphatase family protein [Prevotella sp.]